MAIHWSVPAWLWPLLLIVAAGAILFAARVYARTRPAVGLSLLRLLTALRAVSFVLLVLAVAMPVLSMRARVVRPAVLQVLVEDSASMGVADAGADGGAMRWSRAAALVAALESIVADHEPALEFEVWRGNGLAGLEPFEPERPPTAVGTDLDGLLAAGGRRGTGRPVRATVLITDGQETRRGLGAEGKGGPVPRLLAIGVGDPVGPPDRFITDLRYPGTAHVGDDLVVSFVIDHRRWVRPPGSAIEVRLSGPDGAVADTTVSASGTATPVELTFPANSPGLQVHELSVSPIDDERYLANNVLSLVVDIRPDRQRVLVLAERPGWGVRYLAQAGVAEARLALTVVHGSARGLVRADSLTTWVLPKDADGWSAWDAVILFGWPRNWDGATGRGLAESVGDGLGLVVLPGSVNVGGASIGRPVAALDELLPVTATAWHWQAGDHEMIPGDVVRHPILTGVNRDLPTLPPVSGVVPVVARSGARTLLRARPSGGRRGDVEPLVVVGEPGGGRVLWWGAPLWEPTFGALSRNEADGESGRRILRNLLVWAASGDRESGLRFEGLLPTYSAGEKVSLGATWQDMRGEAVEDRRATVALRRVGADGTTVSERTIALAPRSDGSGGLAVVLPPVGPGRYEVTLAGDGGDPVAGETAVFVVTDRTVEDTQVRRDQRNLNDLSRRQGGRVYDDEAPGLPPGFLADLEAGGWEPATDLRRRRWDPWSGWPFLAVMTVLLGVEWVLRRRHGLL